MYFKNFDFQNILKDINRTFISELSELLDYLEPPLIDKEKLEIICTKENDREYVKVNIPHKVKRKFDLSINFDGIESTVYLADACFHFLEYSLEGEMINDTVNIVAEIMQNTIEAHTYYKGKKVVKIKLYFVNENGEKELFQCSFYHIISLLNPFQKLHEEIEIGSFSH